MKFLLIALLFTIQTNSIEHCNILIEKGKLAFANKEYAKSLELLTEAKSIATENHWHKQTYVATTCIGIGYQQMLDYGEALENYMQAYTLALKELGTEEEGLVLNNIAVLYREDGKLKESEKFQKRAYNLAIQSNDSLHVAIYAGNLATLYNETKMYAEASKYISIAQSVTLKDKNMSLYFSIAKAENLVAGKKFDAAEKMLLPLMPSIEKSDSNSYKITAFLILSKIQEYRNNISKALAIAKNAQSENTDYKLNIEIYNRFSELSFSEKHYVEAIAYKDSMMFVKDSLSAVKDRVVFQNSKIKFDIQDYQKQLDASQKQLHTEKTLRLYVISGSFLIVVFLGWLIWRNLKLYRKKKILSERIQQNTVHELTDKENLLESGNRKLAANALNRANNNEKIEAFIASVNNDPELNKNTLLSRQVNLLKKDLLKEDSEFLTHFEAINSLFLKTLRQNHPALNSNDVRFACYVYMNLTTKEIAALFNITIEAARKRKERIAKKMELADSNQLYGYLSTF